MTSPAGPVTYGELLDLAAVHLTRAALALTQRPPVSAGALTRTVVAYREVLNAFGDHLAAVLDGRSGRVLVDEATQDTITLASRLRAALHRAAPVRPRDLPQGHPDSAIGRYRHAARTIRAASDLLATHTDQATGASRSPESSLLRHLGERGPVLRDLAGLIAATAETEPLLRHLSMLMQERGDVLGVGLSDLAAVRELARATAGTEVGGAKEAQARGDPGVEAPIFGQATVARPAIRTGDPLVEISDRIAAIRRGAWELLYQPEPSLHAITDIARLATHIEATRFRLTAPRGRPLTPVNAPKAGAWHQVWTELRQLRGLTPPDADVRAHARTVEHLIARLVRPGALGVADGPVAGGAGAAGQVIDMGDLGNRRRLAVVLRDAGDQLAQTAPWTHTALERLIQAGEVYVPAGPAEIGEGTLTWHAGRPHWTAAPIPPDKTRAVTAAHRTLDAAYTGPIAGAGHLAPSLGAGSQLV